MSTPSPTDDSAASKCIECGAVIIPTAKFCSECGATQTKAAHTQIKCVACGTEIPESASFCYGCGAERTASQNPQQKKRDETESRLVPDRPLKAPGVVDDSVHGTHSALISETKKRVTPNVRPVIVGCAIVLGCVTLLGLQIHFAATRQTELNRIAAQKEAASRLREKQEDDFNKMTPAQHLAAVKEDLKANSSEDEIAEGLKHLQAVHGTPLEGQGTALRARYETQKAQAEKAAEAEAAASLKRANADSAKQEILARVAMAKTIENGMLSEGYDVDVNAIGANHTTLRIKIILVNKAFAYQTAHSPEIIDSARGAGFKKLVLTDGYDELWNINL